MEQDKNLNEITNDNLETIIKEINDPTATEFYNGISKIKDKTSPTYIDRVTGLIKYIKTLEE